MSCQTDAPHVEMHVHEAQQSSPGAIPTAANRQMTGIIDGVLTAQ